MCRPCPTGPRSPTGSTRARSMLPEACSPPRAAPASGCSRTDSRARRFSRCCSEPASPRPTCRDCAFSPTASPAPRKAAPSRSTRRLSASASRSRSRSPARSRRSPAGARRSSPPPPGRPSRGRRGCWACGPPQGGAGGRLVGGRLLMLGLRPAAAAGAARPASLADLFPLGAWRRVLADRAVAGYTLGYAAHAMELFGSRSWMVAFLLFFFPLPTPAPGFPWHAATIAAVANLVSVSASILGNEIALRIGRRPWIMIAMAASGTTGIVLGLSAPWHWAIVAALLVVYSMLVMAESATLTAGLVAAAPAELRGAAMGLYSLAGFGGGMLGPVVFGVALDAAGGAGGVAARGIAYAAIGSGGPPAALRA